MQNIFKKIAMSLECGKVVSFILLERFGEIVETVGSYLYKHGTTPLYYIKKHTDLPLAKIKESLCILIKFNLVEFKPNRNANIANYSLLTNHILLMLRYPKYIHLIKTAFGDESEMIVEEILHRGYMVASDVLLKVATKLQKDSKSYTLPDLRDKFNSMVVARYLKRIPTSDEEKPVPILTVKENDLYSQPPVDIPQLAAIQKGTNEPLKDAGIYWTVNFDRFHQDMRDKTIVDAIAKKFDDNVAELIKIFLQKMYIRTEPWEDISNPIPVVEVKNLIKTLHIQKPLVPFFDQYVSILEQDSTQVLLKSGEANGGSYQIQLKKIITHLVWETVEQIVLEKFDTKAARIFRLVKTRKYIEPDQIQQLAMIPAKEAKRLSYELLEENFLQIQELKKAGANNGPNKCFTLFHIQLEQIVRMVLELCYKTLYNTMTRRNHDKQENKRIIDKKHRIDTIAMGMRSQGATEEQLADIEEMLTPPEREILDKIDKTMKKLNRVELEVDETMFLLQLYLMYD